MKKNNWILTITILTFFITIVFSVTSNFILSDLGIIFGILIIIVFILLGVIFDMIGIAVASADDKAFHSMASKRIKTARLAIKMIKNSARVSSFCNDVIGDICNIMSGSAAIIVANAIAVKLNINSTITILVITSLIASLTIGGKAYGKSIAMEKNITILYEAAKVLSLFRR